jgi:hypothetical protein
MRLSFFMRLPSTIKRAVLPNASKTCSDPIYSLIYIFVLLWLAIGFVPEATVRELLLFFAYGASFVFVSGLLFLKGPQKNLVPKWNINSIAKNEGLEKILFCLSILVIVVHYLSIGSVPVIKAMMLDDPIEIALVRQSASMHLNPLIAYARSITLSSLLPFLVLWTYVKRNGWFWPSVTLSLFYAAFVMQKSYVFAVTLPAIVYASAICKLGDALKLLSASCIMTVFLVLVTNPHLRLELQFYPKPEQAQSVAEQSVAEQSVAEQSVAEQSVAEQSVAEQSVAEKARKGISGIVHRTLIVPGQVVHQWFKVIPADIPHAYGCGYRPVAMILGCEHVNFSKLVWFVLYQDLATKGLSGTVNAASFMEDYGNFGVLGLVMSAVFMAVLLYFIGYVFNGFRAIGLALNIVPILYLSSSALLTLLFSGGWLFTIAMFVAIFRKSLCFDR